MTDILSISSQIDLKWMKCTIYILESKFTNNIHFLIK